jgi:hypothetical protein
VSRKGRYVSFLLVVLFILAPEVRHSSRATSGVSDTVLAFPERGFVIHGVRWQTTEDQTELSPRSCVPGRRSTLCLLGPLDGSTYRAVISHYGLWDAASLQWTVLEPLPGKPPNERWKMIDSVVGAKGAQFLFASYDDDADPTLSGYVLCGAPATASATLYCERLLPSNVLHWAVEAAADGVEDIISPGDPDVPPYNQRVLGLLSGDPLQLLFMFVSGVRRTECVLIVRDAQTWRLIPIPTDGVAENDCGGSLYLFTGARRLGDSIVYVRYCPRPAAFQRMDCVIREERVAPCAVSKRAVSPPLWGEMNAHPVTIDPWSENLFVSAGWYLQTDRSGRTLPSSFRQNKWRAPPIPTYGFEGTMNTPLTREVSRVINSLGDVCGLVPWTPVLFKDGLLSIPVRCELTLSSRWLGFLSSCSSVNNDDGFLYVVAVVPASRI